MQIIHVIDNLGIGGGQTMLFSLYQSIKKYYPEYKQCILTTERRNTDVKFVSSYKIPYFAIASNTRLAQGQSTVALSFPSLSRPSATSFKSRASRPSRVGRPVSTSQPRIA